jgi:hypothetical protein
MKNIILTSIAVITFFTISMVTGCKNDPCKNITCAFSGVCADGLCKCQVGYEGLHCETVMRDKFLGIWSVKEDGTLSSQAQYSAEIKEGDFVNTVKILNVQNTIPFKTTPVIGTIKNDTITIAPQSFANGVKIEGWGFVKGTNPLDQHYYQHATVNFYYAITNSLGQINKYGYPDDGVPSIWSK